MALKRIADWVASACLGLLPGTAARASPSWQAGWPPNTVFGHDGVRLGAAPTACAAAGIRSRAQCSGRATEAPGKASRAGRGWDSLARPGLALARPEPEPPRPGPLSIWIRVVTATTTIVTSRTAAAPSNIQRRQAGAGPE